MAKNEKPDPIAEIEAAIRSPLRISAQARALKLLPLVREVVEKAAKVSHFRESEGDEPDIFAWAGHMDDLRAALAALERGAQK